MSSDDLGEIGSVNIGPGTIDPREFQVNPEHTEPDYYIAVLLLESTSEDPDYRPLYEESVVLLKAETEEEAQQHARELGKQQEAVYEDENHKQVKCRLKQVVEVRKLEDPSFTDGTELYSRFFRNYSAYRSLELLAEEDA